MTDSRGSRAAGWLARAQTLLPCFAALGCGGAQLPQCDRTDAITVHVHAAKHLNPDRAGLPRSVVVRLYQLADAGPFENSSFDRLWTGAGDDLPKPEQLTALPGRSQAQTLQRDAEAQYLGVAANFRERAEDGYWRAVVPLPAAERPCGQWPSESAAFIELTLADYSLRLR